MAYPCFFFKKYDFITPPEPAGVAIMLNPEKNISKLSFIEISTEIFLNSICCRMPCIIKNPKIKTRIMGI